MPVVVHGRKALMLGSCPALGKPHLVRSRSKPEAHDKTTRQDLKSRTQLENTSGARRTDSSSRWRKALWLEPVKLTAALRHGTVLTPLQSTHSVRMSACTSTQPASSSQWLENKSQERFSLPGPSHPPTHANLFLVGARVWCGFIWPSGSMASGMAMSVCPLVKCPFWSWWHGILLVGPIFRHLINCLKC